MGSLPWWKYHYKYMPDPEEEALFQERVDELRADREFERVVIRYNGANTLAIDRFIHDHTTVHFDSAAEIKVHPDQFLAKFSWPQEYPTPASYEDVSEDVRVLGKTGAAIVQEVDPHLSSYNTMMDELYSECYRTRTKIKRMVSSTGTQFPKLFDRFEKVARICRKINRITVEDHIQANPGTTAEDLIRILNSKQAKVKSSVEKFKNDAKAAIDLAADTFLHGPQREEILNNYYQVAHALEAKPVDSFIKIASTEHPDLWATGFGWVFSDSKHDTARLYRCAWAINIAGFKSLTSGLWPFEIDNIEDFVVIVYQLVRRKNRTSSLSFTQKVAYGKNMYKTAWDLSYVLGDIYSKYRSYQGREESGITEAYSKYNEFAERTINGPKIGDKDMASYVRDSIELLNDRGAKLIDMMGKLHANYLASQAARMRSGKSASLNSEVSPLDYEENINAAIQRVMGSDHCRDDEHDNRRIAFTQFVIDDDSKDDGIGLCLVLKVMKSLVESIDLVDGDTHYTIRGNAHEKLYRMIREKGFGEEFKMKGIVFWKTDKNAMFMNQLRKAMFLK